MAHQGPLWDDTPGTAGHVLGHDRGEMGRDTSSRWVDSKIEVVIKTDSIDSGHAERDKHLRGKDFLDVKAYPEASFVSTSYKETGPDQSELKGELTLHGVTKPVTISATGIGHGPDPWGGYRRGFEGTTTIALKDFGIDYDLGPASTNVELTLSVEGIRQ